MLQITCRECNKQTPANNMYCINCNKVPISLKSKSIEDDKNQKIQPIKLKIFVGLTISILIVICNFVFITKEHLSFLPRLAIFLGGMYGLYYFWDMFSAAHDAKCPECNLWNSYFIESKDVLDSWGRWETRTFQDETKNTQGKVISTTSRQQQVWVSYQKTKYNCKCYECKFTHTYEKTSSWVN